MKENKSLSKYCTFYPKEKVSIYLASNELLQILFVDPQIVEEIRKERKRISREVQKEENLDPWKEQFLQLKQRFPTPYDAYLTYDISKTIPK